MGSARFLHRWVHHVRVRGGQPVVGGVPQQPLAGHGPGVRSDYLDRGPAPDRHQRLHRHVPRGPHQCLPALQSLDCADGPDGTHRHQLGEVLQQGLSARGQAQDQRVLAARGLQGVHHAGPAHQLCLRHHRLHLHADPARHERQGHLPGAHHRL
eukprot:GHVL01003287.1.p2 GENE.GHVL01003287.1~~GHVL01003287.1.p2  ORF type:complete len:154 (-),score=14.54 GHVL01003287.1:413-874(-)